MKMVKEDRKCLRNVKIQHEYSKEICVLTGEVKCGTLEGRGGDKTANTTSITYRRV